MVQVFRPRSNTLSRFTLLGALVLMVLLASVSVVAMRSSYATRVGNPLPQPVPFTHEHHVSIIGIDCRYCHTSVETSSFAGIPPTETCMNCHSQIWSTSSMLAPVRDSYRTGRPLSWNRVNDLPDFVYFDHHIHVRKGVGCVTCHGRVDRMPLTWKAETLQMSWCIDCHRDPARFLRPVSEVFDMDWRPDEDQRLLGERLMEENHVRTRGLTDCSTCHR